MNQINFDAKVWKQGSSLILTIPSEIKNSFSIKEGDIMRLTARIISEKEQKEEAELRRLSNKYPLYGDGTLIHEGEEIGRINQIFCRVMEYRTSIGELSFKDSPVQKAIVGFIRRGSILHTAYNKKHYGLHLLKDPYIKRNLTGVEKIKMKTVDGKELIIKNLNFESNIIKDSNKMEEVEFYGDLEKTED